MFSRFVKEGIGLHTGCHASVGVEMGKKGTGVIFVVQGKEIKAEPGLVCASLERATTLAKGETHIRTVEHLLGALLAFGEADVLIEVEGKEIPILDGSAAPWARALHDAGATPGPRFFTIKKPVEATIGDSWARLKPLDPNTQPSIHLAVDFPGPPPLSQTFTYYPLKDDFVKQIAPARTFAFESEIDNIRGAGLARGGSLECALVLGSKGPLNKEGQRFYDEPVRHKLLDALGDVSLLGGLPWAEIDLFKPGHPLLHKLTQSAYPFVSDRLYDPRGAPV